MSNSPIGKALDEDKLGIPGCKSLCENGTSLPHVLLGDDAFPLRPFLMKPYKGNFPPKAHRAFNYRLSRGRMTVENSFGILAARWRIFHAVIEADLSTAKTIIHASVMLHNFLTSKSDFNNITIDRVIDGNIVHGNWRETTNADTGMTNIPQGSNNYTALASKVRDEFKDYFMSELGKVSWQDSHLDDGYRKSFVLFLPITTC